MRNLAFTILILLLSISVYGQSSTKWIKKKYSITGTHSIKKSGGQTYIEFGSDFKTKNGPDLKIFLSKKPMKDLKGSNVLKYSKFVKVLKSNKGSQKYKIPSSIKLSDYKSVVIHCEEYSVLWGGFDLK